MLPTPLTPVLVCAVAVAALLAAEARGSRAGVAVAKLTAASSFLWAALAWGALDSRYGVIVLVGLALCWLGDTLLIRPGQTLTFQLGIGAFLLGHVAYAVAFWMGPQSATALAVSAAALAVFTFIVLRWLVPHLTRDFRGPVIAYVATIAAMVMLAVGATAAGAPTAAAAGAIAFAASDISVARDRFVAPGFANAAWGLPLYFGAQLLLASTVGAADA